MTVSTPPPGGNRPPHPVGQTLRGYAQTVNDQSPATRITVVIVDDEALIRQGLTLILTAAPDLDVVGAVDGRDAVALIEHVRPNVVLLDIRMPDVDGLTIMRTLHQSGIDTTVVVLTTFDTDEYIDTAMRLGASGFLLKDTDPEQLPHYVRTAAGGGVVLVPSATRTLLALADRSTPSPRELDQVSALTPRESAVLVLLASGMSNTEIGARLHLSVGTVKDHVSAILSKLHVPTRVQAALIADRAGLLTQDDT